MIRKIFPLISGGMLLAMSEASMAASNGFVAGNDGASMHLFLALMGLSFILVGMVLRRSQDKV